MMGMAASTKAESRGLVTTIMAAAPTNSTELRNATETEAPTAALICVVSAGRGGGKFPPFGFLKKARERGKRGAQNPPPTAGKKRSPRLVGRKKRQAARTTS